MVNKNTIRNNVTIFTLYIFIVWGVYRYFSSNSEYVDELFVKPILWLVPVYYLIKKEKQNISTLGITSKNLFPSIYLSLALGVGFAVEGILVHFFKYQGFNFVANIGNYPIWMGIFLSLITAISEEITFRGYIFTRIQRLIKANWKAIIISSLLWSLVHAPIAVFVLNLELQSTILYLLLIALYGIGASFVFIKTKNIVSSILLHVLWSWPIILFR